jgi:hypothetical protein
MRRLVWILVLMVGLTVASPLYAGTGGAEDPTNGSQDVDASLRTAVRWILGIKGLKVIQSERTADLNEYYIDQKASGGTVMKAITDGLNQRKWKVTSKQEPKFQVVEATKDDKLLKVRLAKAGKEPRLTVEIKKVPKAK